MAITQTSSGAVESQVDLFHSRLRDILGVAKWETWIKPLTVEVEDSVITLEAPNRFNATWVTDNYTHQIR